MKRHLILFCLILSGLLKPSAANCQTDSWIIRDPNIFQEFLSFNLDKDKTDDAWLNERPLVDSFPQNYTPASNEYFALYQALFRRYFFQIQNATEQARAVQQLRDLVAKPEFESYRQYIFCEPVSLAVGKTIIYTNDIQTRGLINLEEAIQNNSEVKNIVLLAQELPDNPTAPNVENFEKALDKLDDEIIKSGVPDSVYGKYQSLKKQYSENAEQWKKQWKEQSKKGGDAFDNKGYENGDANSGGGKKKGWFPVDVAFSQWFGSLVEFLIQDIPGLKDIAQKVAIVAYMVAPDLVNNIASTLAKIQHSVTPGGIDDALNHVAEIADYALLIYQNLQSLNSLINNPAFKELVKNVDIKDITHFAAKYTDNKWLKKFNEYFPGGLSLNSIQNMTAQKFQDGFVNAAKKVARDKALEYAEKYTRNIPVLNKIDMNATFALINCEIKGGEYAKQQGKRILCGYAKSFSGACDSLFEGKYRGSVISASAAGLQKATGGRFKREDIDKFITAGIEKEYKAMWNISSNIAADKLAPKIGLNPEGVKQMNLALQDGRYRDFIKGASKTMETKYQFFGKYAGLISTMTDVQWQEMTIDSAKKITDVFLQSTMGNHKIGGKLLANSFDFMLDLGKKTDSLNGFQITKYLKSLKFDKAAIDNFLAGNYNEEINKALDKMIKGMGIIKPEAIQKLKDEGFIAAFDEQRNNSSKNTSNVSITETLKIEKQKWESLWHHELTRQLIYRKLALEQIKKLNTDSLK